MVTTRRRFQASSAAWVEVPAIKAVAKTRAVVPEARVAAETDLVADRLLPQPGYIK